MQILVTTSDNSVPVLKGFAHLFNKYYGEDQPVTVCGFTAPRVPLPDNFNFVSVGKFADYPAHRWSDFMRVVLDTVAEEVFLLLLDDYWLTRKVDRAGMQILYDYMEQFQNVLKFDVTRERLYNDPQRYFYDFTTYGSAGHLDLIKSPAGSNYQMSLWGGLWRRDLMRQFVTPGHTAQGVELQGTPLVNAMGDEVLVMGQRQGVLSHGNVLISSRPLPVFADGGWKIPEIDLEVMRELGYLENLK